MLYGLLITFYIILCAILMLLIMVQKGKSSMGLGSLGGGAQMLFGGSGGQDIFQKLTWILGTIFMAGSLILALMKSNEMRSFQYVKPVTHSQAPISDMPFQSTSSNFDASSPMPTESEANA